MTIYSIFKVDELNSVNSVFRLQGMGGTAAPNTMTPIDFQMPEDRWVSGGVLVTGAVTWGDTLSIKVIDKDNILGYGANTVLRTFAKDIHFPGNAFSMSITVPYVAFVLAGLYFRIEYTNTSLIATAQIALNLYTHIPTA